MNVTTVLLAVGIYLSIIFAVAYLIDARHRRSATGLPEAWIYALSIAVYCTSWTFYGSVGRSAATGFGFLPVYIGPVLVFVFAQPFLRKLLAVSKANHITSIADLIAARYGKRQSLAGLVTLIAALGVVPYISLQLKAVSSTFEVLTGAVGNNYSPPPQNTPFYADTALYVALLMSLFVIAFGTRRVDATEQHRGMVAAVALESLVKLLAFLLVGAFVTYEFHLGFVDIFESATARPDLAPLLDFAQAVKEPSFWSLTVLSALVIFCLPRQFQVTVVENTDPAHLRQAAWIFPAYLVAINIFVLPIALAGLMHVREYGGNPDHFVLNLPLGEGYHWIALVAFIGGVAAATGMIIVETIALATMVSNDLVLPLLIRAKTLLPEQRNSVVGLVKWVRRSSIVILLLLAFAYVRVVGNAYALVSIGLISFAAVAQFAPSIVGGLYWRRGNFSGAFYGLLAGFLVWGYTLLLPSFAESGWIGREFLNTGPFGVAALRPYALLGVDGLDRISHSLLWSLLANAGLYVACSLAFAQGRAEAEQAGAFVGVYAPPPAVARSFADDVCWRDMGLVLERFLGAEQGQRALAGYAAQRGVELDPQARIDAELAAHVEKLIAGAVGSSLARVVVAAAARERQNRDEMMHLLTDASSQIEMQWERLQEAVQNINQGISMFDANLQLVVWNRRFLELFDLPASFGAIGTPFESFIRFNAERGEYGQDDIEAKIDERLRLARSFAAHHFERQRPDGRIIEIVGKPLPHGGFIATYADITERKRIEAELQESEARFAAIFQLSPVPMGVASIDAPFPGLDFNDAWFRTFGWERSVLGLSSTAYGLWVAPEMHEPFMERVRDAGEFLAHEVQLRRRDGAELTVLLSGRRVNTGSRSLILLAYFDVTEHRRAEDALREAQAKLEHRVHERTRELKESEERFRDFADSSSDWLWETDAELRFTYFSERASELLGRPNKALVGLSRTELATAEELQRAPDKWRKHLADIAAHRPFRAFEYSVARADGGYSQVRVSGKPIFAPDGSFLGYRGTGSDVTELVQTQSHLLDAEKLAALGGMVAGVAHEINTPIGIGVTAATYLQEQTLNFAQRYHSNEIRRSEMEAFLRAATEATGSLVTNLRRAAGLVQSFKQVAVDQSSDQRRHFNLREYLREILDSLLPKLKRTDHVIEISCREDIELDSFPGAFSQIITNLVINSLMHGFEGREKGRIDIAASVVGGEILLRYADNGCGMSETQVKRVFEPFFTTRRGQGGSGLGMHVVYNLVTQTLRGRIECHSSPGAGVVFLMVLPIELEASHAQ